MASQELAEAHVKDLVRRFGLGFHPDNQISDYQTSFHPSSRTEHRLRSDNIRRLQRRLDAAREILGTDGVIDYALTLEPWASLMNETQ